MNTSYFGSPKIRKIDKSNLVSISYKPPDYFKELIRIYKPLCPSYQLVMAYKNKVINEEDYTMSYYDEILNMLNPRKVFDEIGENSILLCYEKSGKFCHRRLVADWIEKELGIEVPEL